MSKRILKNIIMIVLIVLLCVAMFFTVRPQRMQFEMGNKENFEKMFQDGTMPEIPEGMDFSNKEFPGNMPEGEMPDMSAGERPSMPDNFNFEKGMGNREGRETMPEMPEGIKKEDGFSGRNFSSMNIVKIILCAVEALGISILSIYLILSKFNKLTLKETFENKSKIGSFIVLVILVTAIITMLVMLINKNNSSRDFSQMGGKGMMMPFDEEIERTTKAEDVEAGENVNAETINLSEHTTNITITEPGTYTLTGEFGNTVLINASGDVVLNLDNAKIENKLTAALANISTNPLTINLLEGTTNVFSDGSSSEYDACVYSAGPLTFTGTGSLEVYGNQEEGEGIATETNNLTIDGGNIKVISNDDGLNAGGDGGTIKINNGTVYIKASGDGIDSNKNIIINGGKVYTIGSSKGGDAGIDSDEGTAVNGGELIALGTDMLEKPISNSKQKVIVQNLSTKIDAGSNLILKDQNGNEITSFTADDSFKTIIISNSKLVEGKYNLYKGEEIVAELECK